jgi:coenzyme F420-reducing hydrogenase beta subunit
MRSPERGFSPGQIARAGLCIGCGGCAAQDATGQSQMAFDVYGQLKPSGPSAWRRARSPELARICPFSPSARDEDQIAAERFPGAPVHDGRIGRFVSAYVGHATEAGFRQDGSSGGLVSWTAVELLRRGLIDGVAHVGPALDAEPDGRLFRYRISRTEAQVRAGAKSRYYPVDLSEVLREMRAVPGHYAVIGIPCFIKAVNLQRAEDPILRQRIAFTLGLFCGHSKSARMAESFAWQLGACGNDIAAIDYRRKDPTRPANWYTASIMLRDGSERRQDWWHLADGDWGAGFFQNAACNACDDVVAETADIAFGDAWVEPYASDGRGTNVVVVRSGQLDGLVREGIAEGRLQLADVDAGFIHNTQAAGFRQRREGLSLRLAGRHGLTPRKRVPARRPPITIRRWAVYRLREQISAWSHRVFLLARRLRRPGLYLRWARMALALYQAITWSRGRLGAALDRLEALTGRDQPSG